MKLYVEKGLIFGPLIGFSTVQFVTQKSIIEKRHLYYSPDLARMPSGCLQKWFALKRRRFQDTEDIQNKYDDGTESYSKTGVPKVFPTLAASLG
jgi:hypothetical protein